MNLRSIAISMMVLRFVNTSAQGGVFEPNTSTRTQEVGCLDRRLEIVRNGEGHADRT